MSSLDSSTDSMGKDEKNIKKEVGYGFNENDSCKFVEHLNKDSILQNNSKIELGETSFFDQFESNFSHEYLKSRLVNPKHEGAATLQLSDLHKYHDADSLPSPTREICVPLPFEKEFVLGHGSVKPEWPVPRRIMHPYETEAVQAVSTYQHKYHDAVQAVSTYQHKFGRSFFYMKDELPSPTPSEEVNTGDCEMNGEVSSSSVAYNVISAVNSPSLGQAYTTISVNTSVMDVASEGINKSGIAGLANTKPNLVSKSSSAKSRDPRLRLSNSDAGTRNSNQGSHVIGINGPSSEHAGIISSRKQKTVDELVLDGPALKRQRNESTGYQMVYDVQAVTDSVGWLEDMGTVTNGNLIKTSVFEASRNLEHEKFQPVGQNTTLSLSNPTTIISEAMNHPACCPFTFPAIQSPNLSVKDFNTTNSLESLLRDFVVNPSIMMNVIMKHDNNKNMAEKMKPISVLEAPPNSSMLRHVSAGTVQSPFLNKTRV